MIPASIGVIANPSSGRDIRRLLGWASVFPTHEKVQTVLRLLAPMGRLGVAEAWMVPDRAGIAQHVRDGAADAVRRGVPMPAVRLIDMAVSDGPGDSAAAAGWLRARGAAMIAVLGGDGTHRAVAAHCGALPLATLSTGTNNAFADRREATLVGMAAALAATSRVPAEISLSANKVLHVRGAGVDERALVDVAVSREPLLGARAVGDGGTLSELFASFAEPKVIGLSSIAGLLHPVARDEPYGVRVRFGAGRRLWAPILPGAMEAVSVAGVEQIHPGRPIRLPAAAGTLALDGEREIEFDTGAGLSVELRLDGPRTLAVEATLAHAARHGLLVDGAELNAW